MIDAYLYSSQTAKEWLTEAKMRAPWFDPELFADFFLCFYLREPELDETREAQPFHKWILRTLKRQYFYLTIHPRTINQVSASFKTVLKALMWLCRGSEKTGRGTNAIYAVAVAKARATG